MPRFAFSVIFALLTCLAIEADDVIFKSDVALTRVDAQVLDRNGRNVTGLQIDDFVLRVNGKVVPIRNFASENMPIDILLLLDVSGSMQPHVERIASAAQEALNVLTDKDRVAIMVFDTNTRVRLPFNGSHSEITNALRRLLRSERFNGGTRITDSLVSAANYVGREARPEARRAVVILTDDETQDEEDEPRVESALARSNAVLSFLQAPYEPPTRPYGGGGGGRRRGTWGNGGGGGVGFPGGGGGWPGGGGGGWPGGSGGPIGGHGGYGGGGDRSHTAGTATIAQDSGGDTMQVSDASALEDTLTRLRQRYALNFYLPDDARGANNDQSVRVELSQEARLRYLDADIHYRRVFLSGNSGSHAGPTLVSHAPDPLGTASEPVITPRAEDSSAPKRRSTAVNEDSSEPTVSTIPDDSASPSSPHRN